MSVCALGYLGFTGPLAPWRDFARGVLGGSTAESDGRLRVRLDEQSYRIEVTPGKVAGVAHVGWDVGSASALEALGQRLKHAGVAFEPGSAEQCRQRGVLALLNCRDPAGTALELYYGRMCPTVPFVSPQGVRFVTGRLGLGHLVFRVAPYSEALTFYRELLGFADTDVWSGPTGSAVFMHCNPRHHSLALRQGEGAPELIHFMLEVEDVDMVGLAAERGGALISRTLGRHFNDRMLSCYFRTPSGFEVEYGTGGRLVDPATWSVGQVDAPSGWGHERRSPAPESAS